MEQPVSKGSTIMGGGIQKDLRLKTKPVQEELGEDVIESPDISDHERSH
jgi:hypothetical protein